ncbi:MAG: MerR family transcriptional regulator [Chloroflexota bacterium]|nr:MerR family transcriptional regulator [Chloroflexota bacterium]
MFKIGEFSRLSQVTVKTLRYYDKIGLLEPADVDRFTSYRYYSASQAPRLNRILALKGLGLALDQIGQLLEGDLTPDQIRGMLRLKQVEIQQQVQEKQARLARVEQRLRQIEQEEVMPKQEVVLKQVPSQMIASVRSTIPISGLSQLFGELFAYLGQRRVNPAGPPLGIYYDEEFREEAMDIEVAAPVVGSAPEGDRVKMRELPAVEEMACVIHEGGYETIGGTYGQLMKWIEAHDYRMAGPTREVYLKGPESGDDPSTYVTEVQIPVEKA